MTKPNFHLPKRKIPQVDEFTLTNGLRGLFIDVSDCSSMSVEFHFQAGHYFSPDDKPELAHFLEHLVIGANQKYRSKSDFSQSFQRFGSNYNAHTNNNRIWYQFSAPDFDWQRSFELLCLAISKPLFLKADFETEKEVIRQELTSRADNEDAMFFHDLSIGLGFELKPYQEIIKKLDNIKLDDIKSYYQKTHGPANARLIVAGSLPAARRRWIKGHLEKLDLPAKKATWQPGPKNKIHPIGVFHRQNPKKQAVRYDLTFSNNQRRLELVESDTIAVMTDLFGDGHESRIWGRLREEGLAYHIDFESINTPTAATFSFTSDVSVQNLEAINDLILDEIDRLLAGDLKDVEVDQIKAKVLGNYLLGSFTPYSWIRHFENRWLNRNLIVPANHHQRLEPINAKKVIAIAHHMFEPKQWTLALHGPAPDPLKHKLQAKLQSWQPKTG